MDCSNLKSLVCGIIGVVSLMYFLVLMCCHSLMMERVVCGSVCFVME